MIDRYIEMTKTAREENMTWKCLKTSKSKYKEDREGDKLEYEDNK